MDNIIKELIDIESRAQEVSQEIAEQKFALEGRLAESESELRAELSSAAEKRIAEDERRINDETERRLHQISQEAKRKSVTMDKQYKGRRMAWQEELFSSVIGR